MAPVEGATGEAGRLIITLSSAAVPSWTACMLGWGVTGTDASTPAITPLLSVGGAAATTLTIKEGVVHKENFNKGVNWLTRSARQGSRVLRSYCAQSACAGGRSS